MGGFTKYIAGAFALLLLFLLRVSSFGTREVRVVYLVPSDREEMPQARQGSLNGLRHLQRWYQKQIGTGETFTMASDDTFATIKSKHPADWFREHPEGNAAEYYWFENAVQEVRGEIPFTRDVVVILLDADLGDYDMEAAAHEKGAFAVLPWRYARSFAGQNIEPPCRAVGVLGHELGHIFGIDHPRTCTTAEGYRVMSGECNAIMGEGSFDYPQTALTESDKSELRSNPAFRKMELPPGADFDCDRLLNASTAR